MWCHWYEPYTYVHIIQILRGKIYIFFPALCMYTFLPYNLLFSFGSHYKVEVYTEVFDMFEVAL